MNKCINEYNFYNLLQINELLNIEFKFSRVYYVKFKIYTMKNYS